MERERGGSEREWYIYTNVTLEKIDKLKCAKFNDPYGLGIDRTGNGRQTNRIY